jgi:hypothetical protein
MRRLVRSLVAAIGIAALLLGAVPTASHASAPKSAKRNGCNDGYAGASMFISVLGAPQGRTMVMGIDGASMDARKRAILANYDPNAPNQRWDYRLCLFDGIEYIQLKNRKSKMCLDKSEDTPNGNGNWIYQYPCGGDTYPYDPPAYNQLWRRWFHEESGSSGRWMQLYNRGGYGCVDITNEQYVNGAYLVQWDCAPNRWDTTSKTQQWNAYP